MKIHKYIKIAIVVISTGLLKGCDSCRPDQSNFALIGFQDIPSGETYTVVEDIPGDQTIDFIGRVYYPSYDEDAIQDIADGIDPDLNGVEVSEGPHPLIIFGHGQYSVGAPNNYLGMTNLMHHLASWGYICISVNLDVLQGQWASHQQGIPQRGELMLHAADFMIAQNSNSSSIFHNRIDVNKIGLIGHSRGGGGAVSAVNANGSISSPRPIEAVATISPVDFFVQPVQEAVPHISLYGTWDGDLSSGHGVRLWSGGTRQADKLFVEIYGANHFHFTDSENYAGEVEDITRDEHHELSQGFFNAFFDKHIKGLDRYDWPLYLTGQRRINSVDYYIQYLTNDFRSIDTGGPLGTETTNNLGGANDGTSLVLFDDKQLTTSSEHFYNAGPGLIAHWDANGDELLFNFPNQNASAYSHLNFRLSQRPDISLNTADRKKNFKVELRDATGATSNVAISNYLDGLQYPDENGSISSASSSQFKSIPRTYRIPLSDFTGIDITQLNRVTLKFDEANTTGFDNTSGAIALDDLEFTKI
ncbi:hypothetical protein [uncultured Eudoraea sp.]|uniref:alpha/beta hydrolase family protein n=1 Tax=uncultured Eudoraea sp. TaxID=1035614 RepID=UPI00260641A6|nr:hypothetical protein [uncultured Eudoraea sp.]